MVRNRRKRRPNRVTFWQFLRDVLVNATNKGQLPALFAGIIFTIIFIRMPREDLSEFVNKLLSTAETYYILGYLLSIIINRLVYTCKSTKKNL